MSFPTGSGHTCTAGAAIPAQQERPYLHSRSGHTCTAGAAIPAQQERPYLHSRSGHTCTAGAASSHSAEGALSCLLLLCLSAHACCHVMLLPGRGKGGGTGAGKGRGGGGQEGECSKTRPHASITSEHYERTPEQNEKLGFLAAPAGAGEDGEAGEVSGGGAAGDPTKLPHGSVGAELAYRAIAGGNNADLASNALLCGYSAPEEVMVFPATCSACGASGDAGKGVEEKGGAEGEATGEAEGGAADVDEVCVTRMFATRIPYFKDVILMSTSCDACGYKNSELKAAGGVAPKGRKITLTVRNQKDLSRDIIKAESAAVYIPEIELELGAGTLGGRVTTVEGLVTEIADSLKRIRPFEIGDSAPEWQRSKWQELDRQLRALAAGEPVSVKRNRATVAGGGADAAGAGGGGGGGVDEWHLVVDDALANSFVLFVGERLEDDGQQDEELGLHDMRTGEQHVEREGREGKAELEAIQDQQHSSLLFNRLPIPLSPTHPLPVPPPIPHHPSQPHLNPLHLFPLQDLNSPTRLCYSMDSQPPLAYPTATPTLLPLPSALRLSSSLSLHLTTSPRSLAPLPRVDHCGREVPRGEVAWSVGELRGLLQRIARHSAVAGVMVSPGYDDMLNNWVCYVKYRRFLRSQQHNHEQKFLNDLLRQKRYAVQLQGLDPLLFINGRDYWDRRKAQKEGVTPVMIHNNYIISKWNKTRRFLIKGMWRVDHRGEREAGGGWYRGRERAWEGNN
ncbi:unnamed protein product [Closterium sp. NIES-53]